MAIPNPQPKDWLKAAADELRIGDQQTLKLLRQSYKHINEVLRKLPDEPTAPFSNLVYRNQLERVRRELLEEQAVLFEKLGDLAGARRLRSASRAAKLSRAADAAYLNLVGRGKEAKLLYDSADITAQRTVETMLARIGLSKVPLAERIYKTTAWMNGRLDHLIAQTMVTGLNAARFAKVARDWFAPSVPGGTRYAAMRLARTEINNAFHATSISYAADKPWVSQMGWNLSKSHPEPDKCDLYAEQSPWDVHLVPRKPHPQCLCYVTEVSMDEDEWIDRFVAGEFDNYLDQELGIAEAPTPVASGDKSATGAPVQIQRPENLPKIDPGPGQPPVPQPQGDGYLAGHWAKDNLNSETEELAAMFLSAASPEKRAAQEAALGPNWSLIVAEQMIGGTVDATDVTYKNGKHRVRFTGALSAQEQLQFLTYVDYLQTKFPTGHDMHITVAPSTQFGFDVGGETTVGTGSMFINEAVMRRPTWPGMPASQTVSSAQYVLAHEWGHAADTPEGGADKHVHRQAIDAGGMTRYGTAGANGVLAPREGYAEAFAEWTLTKGKTTNPATLIYAEHFHWGEKFGTD